MQCVTPMFRRYNPYDSKESGKIVPRSEVMEQLIYDPNYIRFCLNRMNEKKRVQQTGHKYQTIPCGKCYACKLNYSAQWATRIALEAKEYENNYFITLTYDDDHLPNPKIMTDGTNIYKQDLSWNGTLVKEDPKRFIRSLRKQFDRAGIPNTCRFYLCGEYGGDTQRPHYHIILMNCPIDLKQFYDFHVDKRHKLHWKSKELEKLWDKGMIDIAEVEWSSAAYVARYCMKKLTDNDEEVEYYKNGKIPEFVSMSTHPAIGSKYYEDHKFDIYKNDELIMKTVKGNIGSLKPPKVWDKKFKEEFPEQWDNISKSRELAQERSRQMKERLTNYNDIEFLKQANEKVAAKAKMLPRDMEC